eukprot:Sdes_comp17905_c0_seq1m7167
MTSSKFTRSVNRLSELATSGAAKSTHKEEGLLLSSESLIPASQESSEISLDLPEVSDASDKSRGIFSQQDSLTLLCQISALILVLCVVVGCFFYFGILGKFFSLGHTTKDSQTRDSPLYINYQTCQADFDKWAAHFGKNYSSLGEHRTRAEIFSSNVELICLHNRNSSNSFTMGLNQFSDLLSVEMGQYMSSGVPRPEVDLKTCRADFLHWMVFFGKFYETKQEELNHKRRFDENVERKCHQYQNSPNSEELRLNNHDDV